MEVGFFLEERLALGLLEGDEGTETDNVMVTVSLGMIITEVKIVMTTRLSDFMNESMNE